uniref:AlNc14C171G7997 protein n=1 Tax=Albugo laibachii Nc14 TaxID=890382 RepID=F0WNH3_9STRA|nr:AlNc14C171G7997 [Albugo laibachii Nc14]|eukprot:CCA22864.1 AlNc14C171G7997 [Albugo laibachii Nc14]
MEQIKLTSWKTSNSEKSKNVQVRFIFIMKISFYDTLEDYCSSDGSEVGLIMVTYDSSFWPDFGPLSFLTRIQSIVIQWQNGRFFTNYHVPL